PPPVAPARRRARGGAGRGRGPAARDTAPACTRCAATGRRLVGCYVRGAGVRRCACGLHHGGVGYTAGAAGRGGDYREGQRDDQTASLLWLLHCGRLLDRCHAGSTGGRTVAWARGLAAAHVAVGAPDGPRAARAADALARRASREAESDDAATAASTADAPNTTCR